MRACSAPGKIVLFGEHAVVFGEPALAVAISLRTTVSIAPSNRWLVNGESIDDERYRYVKTAIGLSGVRGPFSIGIDSKIPEGSGMGSSAAVAVATIGSLHSLQGNVDPRRIAQDAFEVEHLVQGRASPMDTSTSAHGHAVLLLPKEGDGFLWRIEKNERSWCLHHRDIPPLNIVVGYTGIGAATAPLVAQVKDLASSSQRARESIAEIGRITLAGEEAISQGDLGEVGRLMNRNHKLLNSINVGHPLLDRFVHAVRPFSYGAKLTGAGGGGSMIALTDKPDRVEKAIRDAGGTPFKVTVGQHGLEVVEG